MVILAAVAAALVEVAGIAVPAHATTLSDLTFTGETYDDFSLMFGQTAGQAWSGGSAATQWAWNPVSSTQSNISWGSPNPWNPTGNEQFYRDGDWVELDGFQSGSIYYRQVATSESMGDGTCSNMTPLDVSNGRQKYVTWNVSSTAYCLDTSGQITSSVSSAIVNFRHTEVWQRVSCSNAYYTGDTCLQQHEQWWDDNGHPYAQQLDSTSWIAKGKGMAYKTVQTLANGVSTNWEADGRYYWGWGATTLASLTPTGETYNDFSLMFSQSAGAAWSGGSAATQWTWNPVSSTQSNIAWGDPNNWNPTGNEQFYVDGSWVELDGFQSGSTYYRQVVSSESLGDGTCSNMTPLDVSSGREKYAVWNVTSTAYCLDASGEITSSSSSAIVHFRHWQVWQRVPCSNAYYSGDTCLQQHEKWWDDNGHAYSQQLDSTSLIAKGKGMAYKIVQTLANGVSTNWEADGRYYWTWH
jgi:hypothetical protein